MDKNCLNERRDKNYCRDCVPWLNACYKVLRG